jgi:hypothetical protein
MDDDDVVVVESEESSATDSDGIEELDAVAGELLKRSNVLEDVRSVLGTVVAEEEDGQSVPETRRHYLRAWM